MQLLRPAPPTRSSHRGFRVLASLLAAGPALGYCWVAGCTPQLCLLGLGGIAIERWAVPQPGLGSFSLLSVLLVATASSPTYGPGLAVVVAFLSIWTRVAAADPIDDPKALLRDAFIESTMLCGFLALFQLDLGVNTQNSWLMVAVVAVGYRIATELGWRIWISTLRGAAQEQWLACHGQMLPTMGIGVLTTPVVLLLIQQATYGWLLLLPALIFLQKATQDRFRLYQAERELEILESLSRETSLSRSQSDCFRQALRKLERSFLAQSMVFFSNPAVASCWSSPFQRILEQGKTQEPMVTRALQTRHLVTRDEDRSPSLIFQDEDVAVAIPLGGLGVMYVGRCSPPFSVTEFNFLSNFAQRLTMALLVQKQRHEEEMALADLSRSKQVLEQEVHLLASLLDGSRCFSSTLDQESLLDSMQQLLLRNIRHDCGELWLDPAGPTRRWGRPGINTLETVQAVVHTGQPCLQNDGSCSTLCVPVVSESRVRGALLLQTVQFQAFSSEHEQFLWALGYSLAAALTNAALFDDVVRARQELEQSQVQLVHSSKLNAIGELAAGVAHEINSPLGAIVGTLELVANQIGSEQPKAQERLERARQAAQRAQKIVAKLLGYSRHGSSQRMSISLSDLIHDTLELFGPVWKSKGVALTWDAPAQVYALAKATELQQVVVNLVNNAIDATIGLPPERRVIQLCSRQEENESLLEVKDQGCGISEQNLDKIFLPFVSSKSSNSNAGLGLPLSKQLVEQMGGRLQVRSQLGQGSIFQIRLALGGSSSNEK